MPIPFFVAAGAGLFAGALGVTGHSMAKETNQKAEWVVEDAEKLYASERGKLKVAEEKMNSAVMNLGNTKKDILCGSFMQFYEGYRKVKVNFELKKTTGIDEVLNIEEPDIDRLYNISTNLSGTVMGVATGVALGAVGATFGATGIALAAGGLGATGVAMTPASAILGPAVFVSGISASLKADENLEEARAYKAEVDVAVEKMKTSRTLCNAVAKRSEMMDGLLNDLEKQFSRCAYKMNKIVQNKISATGKEYLSEDDLTDEEIDLIIVTRALAGAVKSVLDVPIVNKNNTDVTRKSKEMHTTVTNALPGLTEDAQNAFYAV